MQQKEIKIKYIAASEGCQMTNKYATTNQKQADATEGIIEGRCNEHDMWGKRVTIVLGVL